MENLLPNHLQIVYIDSPTIIEPVHRLQLGKELRSADPVGAIVALAQRSRKPLEIRKQCRIRNASSLQLRNWFRRASAIDFDFPEIGLADKIRASKDVVETSGILAVHCEATQLSLHSPVYMSYVDRDWTVDSKLVPSKCPQYVSKTLLQGVCSISPFAYLVSTSLITKCTRSFSAPTVEGQPEASAAKVRQAP